MLTEAHYRAVLNFFYFLLQDEGMSISASFKTIKQIQKTISKNEYLLLDVVVIKTMYEVLNKYLEKHKMSAGAPPRSDWKSPKPEYLIAWKEFMRRSEMPSSIALVLRYILDYPPNVIAEALEVPIGTIYFRLGRGLESFDQNSILKAMVKK